MAKYRVFYNEIDTQAEIYQQRLFEKETIIEVEDESGKAVHEVFAEKYP
jgi:hypothetical protein